MTRATGDSVRLTLRLAATRLAVVALALGAAPVPMAAQLVRGTVRDSASGAPLAGVVVSIVGVGTAATAQSPGALRLAATLTDAQGAYALSAGDGVSFAVTAKRIGVRQYTSPPMTLSAGETRKLDITLEEVRYDLPLVTVSAATQCGTRNSDRDRIAALWAEASAALTASELSLRDRLFRATIVRYQRVLEPRSMAVRHETQEVRRSVTEHAFVSFPAESLAAVGYARALDDGSIEHFAPDAEVLLSDAFVRDHCFGLAPATGDQVGLTFEPVRRRRVTDIEGTLWLDARSFELRRLTFRYTNFPLPVRDARTGGEVYFSRLAGGAWYISRWFMRVPQIEVQSYATRGPRASVAPPPRNVIAGFSESGGRVQVEDQRATNEALATLNGRVVDSTGRAALPGARVSLVGMTQETTTAHDGAFRIEALPRGNYTLTVEHPSYSRLGLSAAEQDLEIGEGASSITLVQALDTPRIVRQLCGYDDVPDTSIVLRLVLPPPSEADRAAANDTTQRRMLHLSWGRPREVTPGVFRTLTMATDLAIDAANGATACALPRDMLVRVEERDQADVPGRQWEVRTTQRGLMVVELQDERRTKP